MNLGIRKAQPGRAAADEDQRRLAFQPGNHLKRAFIRRAPQCSIGLIKEHKPGPKRQNPRQIEPLPEGFGDRIAICQQGFITLRQLREILIKAELFREFKRRFKLVRGLAGSNSQARSR